MPVAESFHCEIHAAQGALIVEQIQHIPLDKIVADVQVRKTFDEEGLVGLATSLTAVGQLQPCRVRKLGDKYVIVDGERRYRAAKLAGLTTLAVIIEGKDLSEGEVIQRQYISNCQREDLSPLEKATAIASLMNVTGWKAGEAATRLGISNGTATRLLALLTLPEPIRDQVAAGVIPASAAYELSRVGDAGQQQELANKFAAGRLTRDALAGAIKAQTKGTTKVPSVATGRATAQLGEGRTVTVVGHTLNLEGFIEILEEALAKARKVRPQGVELKTFVKMLKDQAQAS